MLVGISELGSDKIFQASSFATMTSGHLLTGILKDKSRKNLDNGARAVLPFFALNTDSDGESMFFQNPNPTPRCRIGGLPELNRRDLESTRCLQFTCGTN
ncbi:hypothetical protein LINGRAHAP2_LOCUS15396 [Linum grandiflorum]